MNRFVLLRHEVPPNCERPSHFDFMLEADSDLLTWSINELPITDQVLDAVRLPNHRMMYLDFEGPLSDHRGVVRRVDWGTFQVITELADDIQVHIAGRQLRGIVKLTQVTEDQWQWRYLPDD